MVKIGYKPFYENFESKVDKKSAIVQEIKNARTKFKSPKIIASFFAARRSDFYFANAFLLVFLITTISFSFFCIKYSLVQYRIANTFAILFTSISFKWVVNRALPTIKQITPLDLYQVSSIFFICLLLAWHALVGRDHIDNKWSVSFSEEIDKWVLISFSVCFVMIQIFWALWFYVIAYGKIRKLKEQEDFYFGQNKDLILSSDV